MKSFTMDGKSLKRANSFLVLNAIRRIGPIAHDRIAQLTNLSSPTVRSILADMLADNFIYKSGLSESTGGRQATLFRINADSHFAIGLSLNVSEIGLIATNLDGEAIYSKKREFWIGDSVHTILMLIIEMVNTFFAESKVERKNVIGICIGVLGILDHDEGLSISIPELNNWENVNMKSILEDYFDTPVTVANDVHLMGCAEMRERTHEQKSDFIFIACREKIGASVIIGGELYKGGRGNAGIIEDYAFSDLVGSDIGVSELFVPEFSLLPKKVAFFRSLSEMNLGSGEAGGLLSRAGDFLAEKIALLIKVLDIPDIVLGGPYNEVNKALIPFVLKSVQTRLPYPIARRISVKLGKMNYEQFAIGGCYLTIEQFFNGL
jgi:predicted NBD/HSP70 family sugar kinase